MFKVYFKVYSKSLFVNKKGKALKSFAFSIYSKRVRLCSDLKEFQILIKLFSHSLKFLSAVSKDMDICTHLLH